MHYEGGLRCHVAHPDNGAVLVMDASKELGGPGENFSPSDLLSVSLGGCVLSIMAMAARVAAGLDLAGATATVTKQMGNAPRRITTLGVTVRVPGQYDAAQRKRLEAAAAACPVHAVLGINAPIAICVGRGVKSSRYGEVAGRRPVGGGLPQRPSLAARPSTMLRMVPLPYRGG